MTRALSFVGYIKTRPASPSNSRTHHECVRRSMDSRRKGGGKKRGGSNRDFLLSPPTDSKTRMQSDPSIYYTGMIFRFSQNYDRSRPLDRESNRDICIALRCNVGHGKGAVETLEGRWKGGEIFDENVNESRKRSVERRNEYEINSIPPSAAWRATPCIYMRSPGKLLPFCLSPFLSASSRLPSPPRHSSHFSRPLAATLLLAISFLPPLSPSYF